MVLTQVSSRAIKPYLFHELRGATDVPWVSALSGSPIQSDQPTENHAGVTSVYPLTEWEGPRKVHDLAGLTLAIPNVKYQTALRVFGDEIRYDHTGQVMRRVADLRTRWAQHWARLASSAIKAGESTACYDGQFFFDTDHAEGSSGSQSNDLTYNVTTTTAPTAVEMEGAIWQAVTELMELVDDAGEPINGSANSFTLMLPPAFLQAAHGALNATLLDTGTGSRSNTLMSSGFSFDIVANPYLATSIGGTAWTTKFALFVNDGRSLIRQVVEDIKISAKAEGSEFEHDHDAHEYGVMTIRGLGYGDWKSAVLTTLT
jgi:phage major head subunit gpT-like protein